MNSLHWRGEFDTGIREMDAEHRELIGQIMRLQLGLAGGADTAVILEALEQIYAMIAEHFALEEEVMQRIHYKAFADHKEDHDVLLEDLREIIDEVREDGSLDEVQLTDDLDRWFSDHFRLHDARFYEHGKT